jgi:hypothetical protein
MGYSEHDMWNSDENAVQCTTGGLEQGSSCLGIQRSRWWMVLVILCTLDYTFWQLGAALAYLDGDACLGFNKDPTNYRGGTDAWKPQHA